MNCSDNIFTLTIVLSFFFLGCVNDMLDEEITTTSSSINGEELPIDLVGDLKINDFIWKGLNDYYYWQDNLDNLSDNIAKDPLEYSRFISSSPKPVSFFESLKHPDDRFSFIQEDYRELENTIQGVFSTLGVEFGLLRACINCNDLIGFIKFVYKDSNAYGKNIQRGDIFIGVNGNSLKTTNYQSLLFGNQESIFLNMGKIENGAILRKNSDIELIREFDVQINPIQINTIISLENQQTKSSEKIGYLMYNQFIADKSEELNQVFKEYKDQAIDDLVLDLRYNGGGSIRNCVELASMITGQFKNDIFAKEQWNKKTETYLIENFGKETILNRFVGFLQSGEQINSINLSRIFIITSSQTASASELLINGLSPYMEVIHIGGQTTGKNVGSITVYDYVDENQTKNPNHTYAMQPIVLKIANSDGYADYTDGLIPDYFAEEELQNLGSLGAKDEPLLSLALNIIQDSIVLTEKNEMFSNQFRLNNVLVTNKQEMYSDKSKLFRKDLKSKF